MSTASEKYLADIAAQHEAFDRGWDMAEAARKHGPLCEGPDEDGDWVCPSESIDPGDCLTCLHKYGITRPMAPARGGGYICYTCYHAC